jgi:SAM-dependent methyltransferase
MGNTAAERTLEGSRRWAAFYRTGAGNVYPDENLVRLIRGRYAEVPRSGRALDVGFGIGGNLVMLAQSGFEAYGLEVSQESIESAHELAARAGVELRLGLLTDTGLPYPDDFFDTVLSWNAVYYHGSRSLVSEAIEQFRRVLRPGGVLLMSVIHPSHSIVRRFSDDLGDGARRIDRASPHDTRFGLEIFYDGTSSGWRRLLANFQEVEEGYAEADLFVPDRRSACRLFLARKARTNG